MPGEDLRYIDSLLDLADKHDIKISADEDGYSVHVDGFKKDRAYNHIKSQVIQVLKNNRQMLLWRLNNPAEPEGPLPTGHLTGQEALENIEGSFKSLIPSTNAGAASMGALTALNIAAPEATIPAELAVGAGSALLGGHFDPDSSNLGNLATGLGTAAIPRAVVGSVKLPILVKQWLQRPGRQMAPEMTAEIGKVMQGYLKKIAPKSADLIATAVGDFSNTSGKNTIKRVVNSAGLSSEVEQSYKGMIDTTVAAVEKDAQQQLDHLKVAFKTQYGGMSKLGELRNDRNAMKLLRQLRDAGSYRRNIGKDIRTIFQAIKTSGRGAFNQQGELKFSTAAAKAGDSQQVLLQKLSALVNKADPSGSLLKMIQTTRTAYGQFRGFKDLLNIDNAMDPSGRWFNPVALQRYLDGQTNKTVGILENRLKDAFGDLKSTVRRFSPEFDKAGRPVVSDQPLFPKAFSVGERLPLLGAYLRKSIEAPGALTKAIGKTPPLKGLPIPESILRLLKPAGTIATGEALNPPQGNQP